ncbi:MAG: DUF1820 family protein [Gammaproteobacteria bacterium]
MSEKQIYKVVFVNQDQIYEIYVKTVYQSDIYGFVAIENFVFGEKSAIVIDPSEEKLRNEFEGIQRSFIPMHSIIRIDQVNKRGTAKIVDAGKPSGTGGKVSTLYGPTKK